MSIADHEYYCYQTVGERDRQWGPYVTGTQSCLVWRIAGSGWDLNSYSLRPEMGPSRCLGFAARRTPRCECGAIVAETACK